MHLSAFYHLFVANTDYNKSLNHILGNGGWTDFSFKFTTILSKH